MNVNIIIIGAASNTMGVKLDQDDFESWNNIKQADVMILYSYELYFEKDKYNVNIKCFDSVYPKNIKINNIEFFNYDFEFGNDDHLEKNSHNIIIEFCNLYHEDWCASLYEYQLNKYENYKISYLPCGCCWNKYFPFEQIKLLVDNSLYTPFNPFIVDSYFSLITTISYINENKLIPFLVEFKKGIYQILGTLICRGTCENRTPENVLRELFSIIELNIFNEKETIEFNKFLNKQMYWNFLPKDIKKKIIYYLYNEDL